MYPLVPFVLPLNLHSDVVRWIDLSLSSRWKTNAPRLKLPVEIAGQDSSPSLCDYKAPSPFSILVLLLNSAFGSHLHPCRASSVRVREIAVLVELAAGQGAHVYNFSPQQLSAFVSPKPRSLCMGSPGFLWPMAKPLLFLGEENCVKMVKRSIKGRAAFHTFLEGSSIQFHIILR